MRIKTIQLAIHDLEYAQSIRNVFQRDGRYNVRLVDWPDLGLGGIIVVEATNLELHPQLADARQRLVVIVRKESDDLSRIWQAGVRHVVFRNDPPHKARVVVMGAELTLCAGYERSTAGT